MPIPEHLANRPDRQGYTPEQAAALCQQLKEENEYHTVVPINGEEYVAIRRLMFHWTMLYGLLWEGGRYEDNWCYATLEMAEAALHEWQQRGWQGEPKGWHRNPRTGRRRPDGDATQEYIQH